jgi:hypothetical protein
MTTTSRDTPLANDLTKRPRVILTAWGLSIVGLIALMSLPDFDPGGSRGSWFGTMLVTLWGGALVVWALGLVRRHARMIGFKVAILLLAGLALVFGGLPWPTTIWTIAIALAGSAASMLIEAWRFMGRPNTDAPAYRGPICRLVLCTGGMMMLAHSSRMLFGLAAVSLKLH